MKKLIYLLFVFSFSCLLSFEKISLKYLQSQTNPLTDCNTSFGFSLYQALDHQGENLLFSPYSISSCLYMIYLGARGQTAKEMHKTLKLKTPQKDLPFIYKEWNKKMLEKYESCSIYNTNTGWADKTAPILFQYNQDLKENFHAEINNVDFVSNPEEQVKTINLWIDEKTKGNIPRLLENGSVNSDTRLLLTSVLYLKSSWAKPFSSRETKLETFHSSDSHTSSVAMMHQRSFFPYFEDKDFKIAILPFACSRFGLVILLPKKKKSLEEITKKLVLSSYLGFFFQAQEKYIDLKLPKFSLNNHFDLNTYLKKLGMEKAFERTADFSGLNGRLDLYLSKMIHQAVVEVDEDGILATAATAGIVQTKSIPEQKPIPFHVNRDFLFFICDLQDYSLLFLGKIDHLTGK